MKAGTVHGWVWDHTSDHYRRLICTVAQLPDHVPRKTWDQLSADHQEKISEQFRLQLERRDTVAGAAA